MLILLNKQGNQDPKQLLASLNIVWQVRNIAARIQSKVHDYASFEADRINYASGSDLIEFVRTALNYAKVFHKNNIITKEKSEKASGRTQQSALNLAIPGVGQTSLHSQVSVNSLSSFQRNESALGIDNGRSSR